MNLLLILADFLLLSATSVHCQTATQSLYPQSLTNTTAPPNATTPPAPDSTTNEAIVWIVSSSLLLVVVGFIVGDFAYARYKCCRKCCRCCCCCCCCCSSAEILSLPTSLEQAKLGDSLAEFIDSALTAQKNHLNRRTSTLFANPPTWTSFASMLFKFVLAGVGSYGLITVNRRFYEANTNITVPFVVRFCALVTVITVGWCIKTHSSHVGSLRSRINELQLRKDKYMECVRTNTNQTNTNADFAKWYEQSLEMIIRFGSMSSITCAVFVGALPAMPYYVVVRLALGDHHEGERDAATRGNQQSNHPQRTSNNSVELDSVTHVDEFTSSNVLFQNNDNNNNNNNNRNSDSPDHMSWRDSHNTVAAPAVVNEKHHQPAHIHRAVAGERLQRDQQKTSGDSNLEL